MKTRQGFVSNSSSSSFVVLGVLSTDVKIPDKFDPYDHREKLSYAYVYGDGTYVIGKRLAAIGQTDDLGSISMDDLHRMSNEVIEELNTIMPDNDSYPVKIYYGVSPS